MDNDRFIGFYEALKESISKHPGEYKELVKYCPPFFRLLCNILNDKRTPWQTKLVVDAALAYFVLPNDIIPDYSPKGTGYVDDLYLCSYTLMEIKETVSFDLITSNWEGEEDINTLIDEVHHNCKKIIGNDSYKILKLVGLLKYKEADLTYEANSAFGHIERLKNDKRELIGLLAFVINKFYRTGLSGRSDPKRFRDFLEKHEDIEEINRIIDIAQKNKPFKSKQEIATNKLAEEEELKKEKLRIMMRRDTDEF